MKTDLTDLEKINEAILALAARSKTIRDKEERLIKGFWEDDSYKKEDIEKWEMGLEHSRISDERHYLSTVFNWISAKGWEEERQAVAEFRKEELALHRQAIESNLDIARRTANVEYAIRELTEVIKRGK